MNTFLLAAIALFFGIFGAKAFQRLKVPQVVGYIVIGVLLGPILGLLKESTIEIFTPVINIALGLIGFRIGIELKRDVFKRYGRSIYAILLGEGLSAFFIVALLVTFVTRKLYLGLLLGAIASATAPAATTDVLWEYKTRGPLTSILQAIVALDDGLSLIIYGFASVFARSIISASASFTLIDSVAVPLFELAKSCLVGAAAGYSLSKLLYYIKDKSSVFPLTIAAIILTIGLAIFIKADFLLGVLVLGAVLANLCPQECRKITDSIEKFSPPIYVLFFVLVGARLQPGLFLNAGVALLAAAYLIGRTSGKILGAWLGAVLSRAKDTVRKYLGFCLFSQAGVAIGLAMVINHNFSLLGPAGREVGSLVINIITATTFVVQLIGPPSVKFAVTKADEIWRNVSEEDIIASLKVRDVMCKDFSSIRENATLDKIIATIKERESYHFPVVDNEGGLVGLISLGGLRNAFAEEQLNEIVLAKDIANHAGKLAYQGQPLKEVFDIFGKREVDYLPVVQDKDSKKVVGILEYRPLVELVNRKLLERQRDLDAAPCKTAA